MKLPPEFPWKNWILVRGLLKKLQEALSKLQELYNNYRGITVKGKRKEENDER